MGELAEKKQLETCPCGQWMLLTPKQAERKKYCSKVCFYKFHGRTSGLKYNVSVVNKAWIKPGNEPWNKGKGEPRLDGWDGYLRIAKDGKYLRHHRVVSESVIGRPLNPDEVVHHIDNNKTNNDPSNLMVMSRVEHLKLHWRTTRRVSNA